MPQTYTKKRGVPLWFTLVCLTTIPCLFIGAFTIGLLQWGSQNQVNHLYDEMVRDLYNGIISYVGQYFDGMKMVSKGVQSIEPLFRTYNMPENGTYDPDPLIRFMSALTESYRFESIGIMLKYDVSPTSKLSWQIAREFGCPEFIYAFSDASFYPSFIGYCGFSNETVSTSLAYQGTDWGLKPDEVLLMEGVKNETFLPVFPLLNVMTLTYSTNHRRPNGQVYGLTFAEKSLKTVDNYFQNLALENNGVAFIFERQSGLMITASVPGQTTTENPDGSARRLEVDKVPNLMISAAGKSILSYYGTFANTSDYGNIQIGDLLVGVNSYRTNGIDWIVAIVVPENEIFSAVRHFSAVALVTSCLFLVLVIAVVAIVSVLISRHIKKIQQKLVGIANNHTDEKEPLFASTQISELQDLQSEAESFRRPMSISPTDT